MKKLCDFVKRLFLKYFHAKRKKCWKIIDKYCICKENKYLIFSEMIKNYISSNIIIVDAGCGRGSFIKPFNQDLRYKILGVDLEYDALKNNRFVNLSILGNNEHLPIKDNSIDIVICAFVIEHLKEPLNFFAEVSRILKKSGKFIFMTPNKYSITIFLSMMIPHRLKIRLNKFLTNTTEQDTFITYYRANSIKTLDKRLKPYNMQRVTLITIQPPPWAFVFSVIICRITVFVFNIIQKHISLHKFCSVILAVYEKK